ncbi:MAG: BlaI/MecI/CopY family transcriptional regulator [Gemmataceae bacterium]
MARPASKHLTERELDVMHVFWRRGSVTAAEVRDDLAGRALDLSLATITNLIRALHDKGFLRPLGDERPCRFASVRSYEEVSGRLLKDVVDRVFAGSAADLLVRLVEQRKLTPKERAVLEGILKGGKS